MPKLDISIDEQLDQEIQTYLDDHEEIHLSGLVRKLLKEYLTKEGYHKEKKKTEQKR